MAAASATPRTTDTKAAAAAYLTGLSQRVHNSLHNTASALAAHSNDMKSRRKEEEGNWRAHAYRWTVWMVCVWLALKMAIFCGAALGRRLPRQLPPAQRPASQLGPLFSALVLEAVMMSLALPCKGHVQANTCSLQVSARTWAGDAAQSSRHCTAP